MSRTATVLAALLALALCGPAAAQEAEIKPDCAPGAKPVVSSGLPSRPCGSATGVVIKRGPEVVPEPSAVAPEPEAKPRRVIRRVPVNTTTYAASSYFVPYRPATPSYRRDYSFGLELRSGDVTLRIGRGFTPRPRPHGHRHGHGWGRRSPADREPPARGISWPGVAD